MADGLFRGGNRQCWPGHLHEGAKRARCKGFVMPDEDGLDPSLAVRHWMDAEASALPYRPKQRSRQQGQADAGADASDDGFNRAEFQQPYANDAAPRQHGFELQAIGTARLQYHDLQVRLPAQRLEVGNRGGRQDYKFFPDERIGQQLWMIDRPTDIGAI